MQVPRLLGVLVVALLTAPIACERPPAPAAADAHVDDGVAFHTCPMHPTVQQPGPGKCPLCGMDLVPVATAEIASGTVVVDDATRAKIGVRTTRVERRALDASLRAVGKVAYDASKLFDVSMRVGGFVEELKVAEIGARVKKGDTLFLLYSPDLLAAEAELLAMQRTLQKDGGSELTRSLFAAATQRLRLLGLDEARIEAVIARGTASDREPITAPASGFVVEKDVVQGARVEPGQRVFRIADLDRVWIEAEVYEQDLARVKVGQQATIIVAGREGAPLTGKVGLIAPMLEGGARTAKVRIDLPNKDGSLKPEMRAEVKLDGSMGERLVVPVDAVLFTGSRRIVFVDDGAGKLTPRDVVLGARGDGVVEVLQGLAEGEQVVSSGNFLVAAESRIRSATGFWGSAPDAGSAP